MYFPYRRCDCAWQQPPLLSVLCEHECSLFGVCLVNSNSSVDDHREKNKEAIACALILMCIRHRTCIVHSFCINNNVVCMHVKRQKDANNATIHPNRPMYVCALTKCKNDGKRASILFLLHAGARLHKWCNQHFNPIHPVTPWKWYHELCEKDYKW